MRWDQLIQRVSGGVAVVGIIVTSTAVLNAVVKTFDVSVSEWLEIWIAAYRSIFFPILDSTVGRIYGLFGYELTDGGRHFIIIYLMLGIACARSYLRWLKWPVRILPLIKIAITWPQYVAIQYIGYRGALHYKKHVNADSQMTTDEYLLRLFLSELAVISVVVVVVLAIAQVGIEI